jgi:hypothetical protein
LGDPLKGNLLLLYKPLHLEAQQVSTRIEVRRHHRPKQKGGLCIINLEVQNQALLIKMLHKFYTKANIPWVHLVWSLYDATKAPHTQSKRGSFWWKDIFSLNGIYRSITKATVGDGTSIPFWKDFWYWDQLLCDDFPILLTYATNEDLNVADFKLNNNPEDLFDLPISAQAHDELINITETINNIQITPDAIDSRCFCWGTSTYTSAKYYKFIFNCLPADNSLKSI